MLTKVTVVKITRINALSDGGVTALKHVGAILM